MQLLKKINEITNVITWFEIPVLDLEWSITFYETILDIKMVKHNDGANGAAFFPFNPDIIQATSRRVTGVLSKSGENGSSTNGTIVYINESPDIQIVLN